MEAVRFLRYVQTFFLVSSLCSLGLPGEVHAWRNVDAHIEINRLALVLFSERQKNDPLLQDVSLDGDECYGLAYDPVDGYSLTGPITSVARKKKLASWLTDAGYSADEPEGPMAMRHFYDPTNASSPYLADLDWVNGFLRSTIGTLAANPEISALDWATSEGLDLGPTPHEYSFSLAKKYLKSALASSRRDNQDYGKAWRAAGETMHLVADMGLPAHVRNDGHGVGDGDPIEDSTLTETVRRYNGTNWTTSFSYEQNIAGLMHALAAYTNRNFLSKDTIPLPGKTYTANGRPAYASPDPAKLTVNSAGYLESKIDGQTVRLARQSTWYRWGLSKNPGYVLDPAVIADQQQILLPTVVRASEAVLERFLPRFKAEISVVEDTPAADRYVITGRIIQTLNAEWGERLTIRNGVSVLVNDKKEEVKLYSNPDLNEFSYTVSAKPGDSFGVVYDLGGYVVAATQRSLPTNCSVFVNDTNNTFKIWNDPYKVEYYGWPPTDTNETTQGFGVISAPGTYTGSNYSSVKNIVEGDGGRTTGNFTFQLNATGTEVLRFSGTERNIDSLGGVHEKEIAGGGLPVRFVRTILVAEVKGEAAC